MSEHEIAGCLVSEEEESWFRLRNEGFYLHGYGDRGLGVLRCETPVPIVRASCGGGRPGSSWSVKVEVYDGETKVGEGGDVLRDAVRRNGWERDWKGRLVVHDFDLGALMSEVRGNGRPLRVRMVAEQDGAAEHGIEFYIGRQYVREFGGFYD